MHMFKRLKTPGKGSARDGMAAWCLKLYSSFCSQRYGFKPSKVPCEFRFLKLLKCPARKNRWNTKMSVGSVKGKVQVMEDYHMCCFAGDFCA